MEILITGIGGQDGRLLTHFLHNCGHNITGTTRTKDQSRIIHQCSLLPSSVNLVSLDLNSSLAWNELLSSRKFDVIFHLSAQSSVGRSFNEPLSNITNPATISFYLLEAVRLHQPNTKVVFAGSTEVFGSHGDKKINEKSLKKPSSPYAAGKITQEAVASFYRNSYKIWISNAYLSNHESIYRGSQFVTIKIVEGAFKILNKNLTTLKLGNLSVVRDWGWAAEYMEALALLSHKNNPEDLIIATGHSISLLEFATEVFNFFGLSFEKYVEHDPTLLRAGDPSEVHYDTSKAENILGWKASLKGTQVPMQLAKSYAKYKAQRSAT